MNARLFVPVLLLAAPVAQAQRASMVERVAALEARAAAHDAAVLEQMGLLRAELQALRTLLEGAGQATAAVQPPVAAQAAPASAPTVAPTQAQVERAAYDAAFAVLKAGRYAESARQFTAFLERFPEAALAPNAVYWLAESHYAAQEYATALPIFERVVERYPTHDKAPGGLLKAGLTRLNLQQPDAAKATFEAVVQRYPNSDAARLAADRLGPATPGG